MRLLRYLLPKARQSGTPSPRYAMTPSSLAQIELDYDPLVAQLASQCR